MTGNPAIDNPAALFDELFEKRSHLPTKPHSDRVQAFMKMDSAGKQVVLELIASGRLPNEIAIELGVPITYFWEWVEQNIAPEELATVRRQAAESFVLKSILPLTVSFDSPGHASMARALSDQMRWIAERLDPARWGNNKASGPVAPAVTLVFEGVGDTPITIDAKPEQVESKDDTIEALKTLDYIVGGDDD